MCTYIIEFLFINLKPDKTLRLEQNKIFIFFSFLAPVQRFVLYCLFTTQHPLQHLNGQPWTKLLNFSYLMGTGVYNLVMPSPKKCMFLTF